MKTQAALSKAAADRLRQRFEAIIKEADREIGRLLTNPPTPRARIVIDI